MEGWALEIGNIFKIIFKSEHQTYSKKMWRNILIVYHLIGLPFALKLKVSIVMLYILCSQTPLLTFEYWDNYSAAHIWVMNSPGIGPFARPYQFPYVHHYSLTQCINHHAYHPNPIERNSSSSPTLRNVFYPSKFGAFYVYFQPVSPARTAWF